MKLTKSRSAGRFRQDCSQGRCAVQFTIAVPGHFGCAGRSKDAIPLLARDAGETGSLPRLLCPQGPAAVPSHHTFTGLALSKATGYLSFSEWSLLKGLVAYLQLWHRQFSCSQDES